MLLTLLAITVALFPFTSSNALSVDSFHQLARHQHIAVRHPAVERATVSHGARCKRRNPISATAAPSTSYRTSTAPPASSSQAPPSPSSSGKGKVGIAWAYGDDPILKNFVTEKVSAFVDFFLFS